MALRMTSELDSTLVYRWRGAEQWDSAVRSEERSVRLNKF